MIWKEEPEQDRIQSQGHGTHASQNQRVMRVWQGQHSITLSHVRLHDREGQGACQPKESSTGPGGL